METTLALQPRIQVLTPTQGEGPFYPTLEPHEWHEGKSLYILRKRSTVWPDSLASRERLRLRISLAGAGTRDLREEMDLRVQIWHASREGRYLHPGDAEGRRLWDPKFRGSAEQPVGRSGCVDFYTSMPGIYWDPQDGPRPRHVHLKLWASGGAIYTTQIYFEGDRLNSFEESLERLQPERRRQLIVPTEWDAVEECLSAEFCIHLS